ncbi:MAG: hypothetical protein M1319_01545, partial [Chloroflexi bacterium]|nr:hypothetical protein [Chloroflexota bacterium]
KWTNPEGGFFIWLTLEPEVVTEDLLGYAMAEGVAFVPGSAFDLTKTTTNSLRLSYSFPNEEEIGKGISLLANALRQYRKDKGI